MVKKYPEIVILHIVGCGMILLCHFCQNANIGVLGEFFLAGLSLFFLVSGFLAGLKNRFDLNWIKRRFVRVLKPYYAVIIIACVLYFCFAKDEFNWRSVLYLFTCTQGLNYLYWPFEGYQAMAGFGHFWYVTEILVCILLTPILNSLYRIIKSSTRNHIVIILFLLFVLQPIAIISGIQLSYIITYLIGFVVSKQKIEFDSKSFTYIFFFFIIISLVRLLGMVYIDGTVIYDRYIALVSQMSLSLVVFFAVFYVGKLNPFLIRRIAFSKLVDFLSPITYEIYLIHCLFLKGAWPIQLIVRNVIIADTIVVLLSMVCAYALNRLLNFKIINNENMHCA